MIRYYTLASHGAGFGLTIKSAKRTARASAKGAAVVDHRELYVGLVRLHVLYHACKEAVYGLEMIEELRRHGYELSAGTLYPLLHGLERKGLLRSVRQRIGGTERRVYRATRAGRAALSAAKAKVRELFGELFEEEDGRP